MLKNGYVNELRNSVLISVENEDEAKSAALSQRLTEEVNKLLACLLYTSASWLPSFRTKKFAFRRPSFR